MTTADYERALRENCVILSADERRDKIAEELAGVRVKPDAELLDTLVYLTEFPTPILGTFDRAVSGAAGRSADHRDAASPEILFGGGCRTATSRRTSSR